MDQAEKLSVTVTSAQARRIRERVESGEYASASEVIREGLRSLERSDEEHRERIEGIRARIQASLDDPRPSITAAEMRRRLRSLYVEDMTGAADEASSGNAKR
jgi:antitoxin ParD1/3/4